MGGFLIALSNEGELSVCACVCFLALDGVPALDSILSVLFAMCCCGS